jgi:hypothetical protein
MTDTGESVTILDLGLSWDTVVADPCLLANGRKSFLLLALNSPTGTRSDVIYSGDQLPFIPLRRSAGVAWRPRTG